jgi:hypothetical protein
VKVNTKVAFHPRVMAIGNAAFGEYVLATSYAHYCGSDGRVNPEAFGLAPLIDAGLVYAEDGDFWLTRWQETTRRSAWHTLGVPTDAHPLIAIKTSWAIQVERERRKLSPELRAAIISRDGLVCQICGGGVAGDDIHIDHILPVSLGGLSQPSNLQVTHSKCNLKKGARV